ncbi:LOW QUALITY PROTEIN: olfactory receptor 52A1-like [Gastrophryne carolinensis]
MLNTTFYPSYFILVGIPGIEKAFQWISAIFCLCYILSLFGNMVLPAVISASSGLHKPMFIFLALLAVNDALLSSSATPKMLSIFWFKGTHISFVSCLIQMFFIHSFTSFESGLLLGMAFDRYIAICQHLRYSSIMTNDVIIKIAIALITRAVVLFSPCIILIRRFKAFKTNIVDHSYCEHMAIVKLAAANIRVNSALGLTMEFTVLGVDLLLIVMSYCVIFQAVFRLPSKAEARLKTFNTCIPHICVFLSFHGLALFTFLTHQYGKKIPPYIHIILADTYVLLPPTLNPLVYGMKTRQIREQVWKDLCTYGSSLRK